MIISELIAKKEVEVERLMKEAQEEMLSLHIPVYVKMYDVASYQEQVEKLEHDINLLKAAIEE